MGNCHFQFCDLIFLISNTEKAWISKFYKVLSEYIVFKNSLFWKNNLFRKSFSEIHINGKDAIDKIMIKII